ncbi:MAG TPA: hypothetical protein VEW46_15515 [Pyrinomonadaceae bacterium]|nr:hypothetical protein [Pyrinomonadaceae bacterium]
MPDFDKEQLLKKFLVGQLSEDEQAAVEDRIISDDDFFERLLVIEDEMIDAYTGGELSAGERKLFEAHFHSAPHNLERLEFANTLRQFLVERQSESNRVGAQSWWRMFPDFRFNRPVAWATAMVLVAVAFGAIWIFISRTRIDEGNQRVLNQPSPPGPAQVVPQKDNVTEPDKALVTPTPPSVPSPSLQKNSTEPARPVTATFILTPGLSRDAGSARDLIISPATTQIQLRLPLEQGTSADFKNYRVLLSLADGEPVWSGVAKPAGDRTLGVNLPARLFQRGDYVLELKGVAAAGNSESVAEYSFRILQK